MSGSVATALPRLLSALLAALLLVVPAVRAQDYSVPHFWDAKERLLKPDLTGIARVRFLTTVDFPPFNFIDDNGLLTGFHVDLARAMCHELDLLDRCQIQALPWEELEQAMEGGQGEALIAGLAVTAGAREKYAFTRPYMRFPARFVVRSGTLLAEPLWKAVSGRPVGVIEGSGHEVMMRDYFPEARMVAFSDQDALFSALREGAVEAVFGDGMRLAFWLASGASEQCCAFAGGPFLAAEYFGSGLAVAVPADRPELADAFDYALRELNMNGTFEELYLRYFPVSFY